MRSNSVMPSSGLRHVPGGQEWLMQPDRYATVLVAIINNPRDLGIARGQHWYRIPVKRMPKRALNAPILAFYQTREFGPEKWAINYYAHTTGWEVVPRVQLFPDEAQHPRASESYYKVHLQELQLLPHPIPSKKWRRVAFIVTHWARLEAAQEISELMHGSIWEERLWRALRTLGRLAEEDDLDEW